MSHTRQRVHATACPHCGGRAMIRSSKPITALCRQIYYRCENDDCGHEFVAQLGILHSTRASARPNPSVYLPVRTAMTVAAVATLPPKETEPADFAAMLHELDVGEARPEAA